MSDTPVRPTVTYVGGLPIVTQPQQSIIFGQPEAPAAPVVQAPSNSYFQPGELSQIQVGEPVAPGAPQAVPEAAPRRGQRTPTPEVAALPVEAPKVTEKDAQDAAILAKENGLDVPFDDPSQLPGVHTNMVDTALQMGESENATLQQISDLQETQAAELRANADRIYNQMNDSIERDRVRQEAIQARADTLFSTPFDPGAIFHGPDAAASMSAHVGIAVGSIIQSVQSQMFPGSNPANLGQTIVTAALERDVARQREEFRRGEIGLRQNSAFATAMAALDNDEVQALQFVRASGMEAMAQEITSLATAHDGTRAGEAAKQWGNSLRMRAMELRQGINAQMYQAELAARPRHSGGGGTEDDADALEFANGVGLMNLEQISDPTVRAAVAARQASYGALTPNQRHAIVGQQQEALELQGAVVSLNRLLANDMAGINLANVEDRAYVSSLASIITMKYKEVAGAGALDAGLVEVMRGIVGSPDNIVQISNENRGRLTAFRTSLQVGIDNQHARYGLNSDLSSYIQLPHGTSINDQVEDRVEGATGQDGILDRQRVVNRGVPNPGRSAQMERQIAAMRMPPTDRNQ